MDDERSLTDRIIRKKFCSDCCVPVRTHGGYTVCASNPEKFKQLNANIQTQQPRPRQPLQSNCDMSCSDQTGVY